MVEGALEVTFVPFTNFDKGNDHWREAVLHFVITKYH